MQNDTEYTRARRRLNLHIVGAIALQMVLAIVVSALLAGCSQTRVIVREKAPGAPRNGDVPQAPAQFPTISPAQPDYSALPGVDPEIHTDPLAQATAHADAARDYYCSRVGTPDPATGVVILEYTDPTGTCKADGQ